MTTSDRIEFRPPRPEQTEPLLDEIVEKIRSAKRAQVIGHIRPDGDCLGSLIGMHHLLEHFGVEHALAAEEIRANGYDLIAGFSLAEDRPRADFNPDLTIYVDCADRRRAFEDWTPQGFTINIDHHQSNDGFAKLNWIEPECAAVGEMLFYLVRRAGVPLGADLATALLLALVTDTGSFRYSNVKPRHFDISAELMRGGADVTLVSKAAYESRLPEAVELTGAIYASIRYPSGGRMAWAEARQASLQRLGGSQIIPENLASELRSIKGVVVSILFVESEGGLRASLRGEGRVDVSEIASRFGGGGHPPAAGITIAKCDYLSKRDEIIECAQRSLEASIGKPD